MPKQTSLFLTKEIINTGQSFMFGETGVLKPVAIAGNDDSIVKSISLMNTTISGNFVAFYVTVPTGNGLTANYPFANIQVPPNAGSGIAPAIDIFATSGIPSLPIDNAGKRYYPLGSGCQIRAQVMHQVSPLNANNASYFQGTFPPSGMISITSIIENY